MIIEVYQGEHYARVQVEENPGVHLTPGDATAGVQVQPSQGHPALRDSIGAAPGQPGQTAPRDSIGPALGQTAPAQASHPGEGQTAAAPPSRPFTSVLAALAGEPSIFIPAPCGGKGRCGKCLIQVLSDPPPPSETDQRYLSQQQMNAGYRLACTCPADQVARIRVPDQDQAARVKGARPVFEAPAEPWEPAVREGELAAAIDIGTTTVAGYLVTTATGDVEAAVAELNRQAVFGADVISRIGYSEISPMHVSRLTQAIRAQTAEILGRLAKAASKEERKSIGTVVFTGNTTMLHLLAGVSPAGIGRAPFVPEFIETRRLPATELEIPAHGTAVLMPSVAAYVGSDMVCAAVDSELDGDLRTTLLADVGTNGELALSHDGTIYACSTAAGPAFEGATISAGVGGVAGAISSWYRTDEGFDFDTIDNAPAVGICGAGLLDLMAALVSDGIVDETGRISPDTPWSGHWAARLCSRNGEPAVHLAGRHCLTQKDIREVQLAKAAIAAGIAVLCAEAGITTREIQRIVLTGGFGNHLRIRSAVAIGLLPETDAEYFTVDNGAGRGAIRTIRQSGTLERAERLAEQTRYVELSGHALFQERYVQHMLFDQEVWE